MPTETNRDMRAKPETIGRMPRTPSGLSDDAWPDIEAQSVDMPAPPLPWPVVEQTAGERMYSVGVRARLGLHDSNPDTNKPWTDMPDRDWFSWRDWEWRDLWAVAFVGVVLAFAAHVVGWWPA